MSALEDQLDVVVDADGAGDSLLHLAVARLQLLQQVVLLRVLGAGAAVHFCLVCGRGGENDDICQSNKQLNPQTVTVGYYFPMLIKALRGCATG